MANRYISTNYWKDNYIADLDPTEKLLFVYLLTNPKTNIAGVYEINIREIAFDTGIDKDMVLKIMERFTADGKASYVSGYVLMKNWVKHQSMNPSVRQGIDRCLKSLPTELLEYVLTDDEGYSVGIAYDRLYTGSPQAGTYLTILNSTLPNLTKLNLTKPNVVEDPEARKVTTKELDGMFEYWSQEVGYSITSKVRQNREFAGKLLKEYERGELALMIKAAALASEDQYAPGVSNFIDLYRKWDALKLWGKKKGVNRVAAKF